MLTPNFYIEFHFIIGAFIYSIFKAIHSILQAFNSATI